MFNMIKELVLRVKGEMEDEKQTRAQGHEAILSLMEDATERMRKVSKASD